MIQPLKAIAVGMSMIMASSLSNDCQNSIMAQTPVAKPAYRYKNVFREAGHSEKEIDKKLNAVFTLIGSFRRLSTHTTSFLPGI